MAKTYGRENILKTTVLLFWLKDPSLSVYNLYKYTSAKDFDDIVSKIGLMVPLQFIINLIKKNGFFNL